MSLLRGRGGGLMRGIEIPQYEFARKMQGGRICGTLRYCFQGSLIWLLLLFNIVMVQWFSTSQSGKLLNYYIQLPGKFLAIWYFHNLHVPLPKIIIGPPCPHGGAVTPAGDSSPVPPPPGVWPELWRAEEELRVGSKGMGRSTSRR